MLLRTDFEENEIEVLKRTFDFIAKNLHRQFNEFIRVVQNSKQSEQAKKSGATTAAAGATGTAQDLNNERKAKVSNYHI